MEPWSTQNLLNDPVINPAAAVPQRQPQYFPQQPQPPPQPTATQRPKRPRSTSPAAPSKRNKPSQNIPSSTVLATQLEDPKTRNEALETLLKLSSSADLNYSLGEEDGDAVLQALVNIIYKECLDYDTHVKNTSHFTLENDKPLFDPQQTWKQPPTKERQAWIQHSSQILAKGHYQPKLLQTVLVILRNLSFVSSNIVLMRNNTDVMGILMACLYESHDANIPQHGTDYEAGYNLALHALFTLLNLIQQPHLLDVTGQQQVCNALFLNNTTSLEKLGWGGLHLAKKFNTKEDVVDVSTNTVLELASSHLIQVWSLFSALNHVLTNPTSPRSLVMLALDVLKECLDQVGGVVAIDVVEEIPSMAVILRELPDGIIERCLDCLWIPRLGSDALDYVNPLCNMVARVSALKLKMGYDATVDTDLRDRSLDVLVPWLSLDEKVLAAKLGLTKKGQVQTRFYDAVVPILTTRVGRNDAPLLATQLLKYMASSSENKQGMLYIQDRVLELASRDARIAQVSSCLLLFLVVELTALHTNASPSLGIVPIVGIHTLVSKEECGRGRT